MKKEKKKTSKQLIYVLYILYLLYIVYILYAYYKSYILHIYVESKVSGIKYDFFTTYIVEPTLPMVLRMTSSGYKV